MTYGTRDMGHGTREERNRWLLVCLFAVGMAWVEAACVYYLRVLVDRIVPYQPNPLPIRGDIGGVELIREAATLVMLLTVGLIAGRTRQARIAYSAIAFGVWDVFYYVFLRIMTGWPTSLLDWDILFLLPLPWWGPVIAPVSIALLMIVWGTLVTQWPALQPVAFTRAAWTLSAIGIVLALYVFMADALRVIDEGIDATTRVLPTAFNWPLFAAAVTMMAAPIVSLVRGAGTRRIGRSRA